LNAFVINAPKEKFQRFKFEHLYKNTCIAIRSTKTCYRRDHGSLMQEINCHWVYVFIRKESIEKL